MGRRALSRAGRRRRLGVGVLSALVGAAALLSACTATIAGNGARGEGAGDFPSAAPSTTAPSESPGTVAPSGSASAPSGAASTLTCPTVTHVEAALRYACLSPAMTPVPDTLWPVMLGQSVEDGWMMNEGSGLWGPADGSSLKDIAADLRQQAVEGNEYGPDPGVHTLADSDTTVSGRPAHILQTQYTIDPTYAAQNGLTVRTEKAWIVAIATSADSVSVWFVSVPDLADSLVVQVPGIISGIKVI